MDKQNDLPLWGQGRHPLRLSKNTTVFNYFGYANVRLNDDKNFDIYFMEFIKIKINH